MNRHSARKGDKIEYSLHLIFDDNGGVRLNRAAPDLARNERSVALVAKLPVALFTRPALRATLNVDEDEKAAIAVDLPALQAAVQAVTGVDVQLEIVEPE